MPSTPELQVSDFVPREAIQRALTGTTEVWPHALTISPATPKLTVPGADIRFRLDPAWTHFAHQSTGTGIMRMVLATGTGR